jgi:hypothetical protein
MASTTKTTAVIWPRRFQLAASACNVAPMFAASCLKSGRVPMNAYSLENEGKSFIMGLLSGQTNQEDFMRDNPHARRGLYEHFVGAGC